MLNLSNRKKRSALEKIFRVRLENLRLLTRNYHSQAELARVLDYTPAFLTHLMGENPKRTVGEKLARDIEAKLGLHTGWLDIPH